MERAAADAVALLPGDDAAPRAGDDLRDRAADRTVRVPARRAAAPPALRDVQLAAAPEGTCTSANASAPLRSGFTASVLDFQSSYARIVHVVVVLTIELWTCEPED